MKNSFILYNNYQKHLAILTLEQKGILLDALFKYSESGETPKLEPVLMMAFNFIAEDMDINRQKWEAMAEVRSEAGKKGAKARWKDHEKDNTNKDKIAKNGKRILPMANDGKHAVNVNVNVNDNVNDIYISEDLGRIVKLYNQVFEKNISSTRGFENNYTYWREVHSFEKIQRALENARKDRFWKDKMTLTILFRRKNTNGEPVDYIEDLASRKPSSKGIVAII